MVYLGDALNLSLSLVTALKKQEHYHTCCYYICLHDDHGMHCVAFHIRQPFLLPILRFLDFLNILISRVASNFYGTVAIRFWNLFFKPSAFVIIKECLK